MKADIVGLDNSNDIPDNEIYSSEERKKENDENLKIYLRVKISDNGPGINNSKLKHIFHPYLNRKHS